MPPSVPEPGSLEDRRRFDRRAVAPIDRRGVGVEDAGVDEQASDGAADAREIEQRAFVDRLVHSDDQHRPTLLIVIVVV